MNMNHQQNVATLCLWPKVTAVIVGANRERASTYKEILESLGIEATHTLSNDNNISISLNSTCCSTKKTSSQENSTTNQESEIKFTYLDVENTTTDICESLRHWIVSELLSNRSYERIKNRQQRDVSWLIPLLSQFNDTDALNLKNIFRDMMISEVELLKTYVKQNDLQKLLRLIHKIKGSSSIAEARTIAKYCKMVEEFGKIEQNENSVLVMSIILIENIQDLIEIIDR